MPSFKNKCHIIISKSITVEDEYIKLLCNSETNIYDLPKIVFTFGDDNQIQLVLTSELLFYKQYDIYGEKFFYMTRIEFSKINKNWVIGRPLLNNVNLIFNLDENNIKFIFEEKSDLNLINLRNKSNSNFKKVVTIIFETFGILILIFALIFLVFYCHRKRKTMQMKDYMSSKVQKLNEL